MSFGGLGGGVAEVAVVLGLMLLPPPVGPAAEEEAEELEVDDGLLTWDEILGFSWGVA